jgi:signal peptidase I
LILSLGQSTWRPGVVTGNSMAPSLPPGSVFLFQRCTPEARQWQPGDVVLLHREGETWIKRIYATAGTRFWAMQEQDGDRNYTRPIRAGHEARFSRIAAFQRNQGHSCQVVRLKVPAGKVFVVGDGLSSRDSREIGPVAESEIVGRVVTAAPHGLSAMPEWVELSFPSRTAFEQSHQSVPPGIIKREISERKAAAFRSVGSRAQSARPSAA